MVVGAFARVDNDNNIRHFHCGLLLHHLEVEQVTTAFQVILAVIAAVVAVGLYRKRNMWAVIILYWVVLTLKNIVEVIR